MLARRCFSVTAAILAATLFTAACTQDGRVHKETAGTVIGGILGIIIGSQVGGGTGRAIATAAGGVTGAVIGREIGRRLDEQDRALADQAADEAMKTGQPVEWNNPDSGNSGSVIPESEPYQIAENDNCRDFETTVTVDGETQVAHGRACQQSDGSWKIIE